MASICYSKHALVTCVSAMCKTLRAISTAAGKKPVHRPPFMVSVEGNIGSGKSTLMEYLKQCSAMEVIQEPVDKWTEAPNVLHHFYEDPKRWGFLFNTMVLLSRVEMQVKQTQENKSIRIIERSIHSSRWCFIEEAFQSGNIERVEHYGLNRLYDSLVSNHGQLQLDLIVYVDAAPEACRRRILGRGRVEESGISLEYLELINEWHVKWVDQQRHKGLVIERLDANGNLDIVKQRYDSIRQRILDLSRQRLKRQCPN